MNLGLWFLTSTIYATPSSNLPDMYDSDDDMDPFMEMPGGDDMEDVTQLFDVAVSGAHKYSFVPRGDTDRPPR